MHRELSDFDPIRPYRADEYQGKLKKLLGDREFKDAVDSAVGSVRRAIMFHRARRTVSVDDLQKKVVFGLIEKLLENVGSEFTFNLDNIDAVNDRYLFISNHRDIVLDATLLDYCMILSKSRGIEIAIGDNLLIRNWIEDLVRLNKSFIVRRSIESPAEFLEFSKLLSDYIHTAIRDGNDSVWIAQREGRAKDSNDLTQRSLLKMLAISDEEVDVVESLKSLHIVPLAISYEYDPCDWLKAMEFQMKRDDSQYRKTRETDLLNMKTGIFGFKGRIHYQAAECASGKFDGIDRSRPRNLQLDAAADIINRGIHQNYRIYPGNRIALDMLQGDRTPTAHYTEKEKKTFEQYVEGQLSKINLPNPDWNFLRERILEMYANPLINHMKATEGV